MTQSFRDSELSGWTARAESYDKLFTPISNQTIPAILAKLGDVQARHVLDICCGSGHLTAALRDAGADAEGLDFARTMVAKASEHYSDMHFRQGDAECLPYADASFDHIVCSYGLMHLSQPDLAIAEAHRVLRPSGRYVFTQWSKDDELLRIVSSAIAGLGDKAVQLPPAPPMMRFADPDECNRVLTACGFENVTTDRIDITWQDERPQALLDLIYGSAVRAAMMIEAQSEAHRAIVHDAILRAARAHKVGNTIVIRRPTVLVCGTKSAK